MNYRSSTVLPSESVLTLGIDVLLEQYQATLPLTHQGPPNRTSNQFFGVGPITDGVADEAEARALRFEFEHWLERNYRKLDDKGRDLGPFTAAELGRSMHRGYPADKVILDMMREIHRYFGFPKENRMAVGLGGGHSGFTVAALHLVSVADQGQHIFIDTPAPESNPWMVGGFFRQSWAAQIVEMLRLAKSGDENRLQFAEAEGHILPPDSLRSMGVRLFFGVGHETTGATTYSESDIKNLLSWLDSDPDNHHAVLDATSMLGAMPWDEGIVRQLMAKCCFFMPFQKAIGGISGYYVVSFTPQALNLVEANQKSPGFAIPRQLKLAVPVDAKLPLTGERTVAVGPFYDAVQLLTEFLGKFAQSHPNVMLEVTCDLSKNLIRRHEQGEFDLVIALHDDPGDTAGTKVFTEPLVWITSADHARHEQKPLSLVVAPSPCIYRNRVLQTLNRLDRPWRIVYASSSYSGISAAVRAGIGVTVMAESTTPPGVRKLGEQDGFPSLGELEVRLHASRENASEATRALADYVASSFAKPDMTGPGTSITPVMAKGEGIPKSP